MKYAPRARAALRVALSYYIANGIMVAIGLALISGGTRLWLGPLAAAAASVGVIVTAPPDLVAPRRGKFWQMLLAPLIGIPLFFAVQLLHAMPLRLGLLLVPASFLAFLAMAWGKRGIPIAVAVMFSMIFSMATPPPASLQQALATTLHFSLGAGLYVLWAVAANLVLNMRYRVQFSADLLCSLAALMRTQARQLTAHVASDAPARGQLLRNQATLADQLQATRDIVLESPRTPRRQQLAGMLIIVLEMRDHLLASELDLDALHADTRNTPTLSALRRILEALARDTVRVADALLLGRTIPLPQDRRPQLAKIPLPPNDSPARTLGPSSALLARAMINRVGHLNDELQRLAAMARGEHAPDLPVVRANWQVFVSPTAWSFAPFFTLWRWNAPPLRHAIRAALAIATGYVIALGMPWGSHDYWILLTISVVLRGSLSQTLERRNLRVTGTLLGCMLAMGLLALRLPPYWLLVCMTVAQAIAHGFTVRRYLVTAVAATVVGLVQAHLLNTGVTPAFALVERIADTLIGAGIAWGFCYVLPSWERRLIPALVARVLRAQAEHARLALSLGQFHVADDSPELKWRLARREAFDSLSALVQATQRSLSEPRAVRPPLEALEHLQTHGYQLLAQMTAVKTMLVLRRDRLTPADIEEPLQRTSERIKAVLLTPPDASSSTHPQRAAADTANAPLQLPDPFYQDLSPWVLRRLDLATRTAEQLQEDAALILQTLRDSQLE